MNTARYEHIHADLRNRLEFPVGSRVEGSAFPEYVPYPWAETYIAQMISFGTMGRVDRMPCGLVFGPSNNGKTKLLDQLEKRLSRLHSSLETTGRPNYLRIMAPSLADESRLCLEILASIGAPMGRISTAKELPNDAAFHLRSANIRLLLIDEFHQLITGSRQQTKVCMNTIRNISTRLQISVVGFGLQTAYNALFSDPQLENRFYPMPLSPWSYGANFKELLTRFESRLLLKEPSNLASPSLARKIHAKTAGLLGEVRSILSEATKHALENGKERITEETLSKCGYLGPAERRERFTGNGPTL